MPIVQEGIFGLALASMQHCCEAKKKEDEALQPKRKKRAVFSGVVPELCDVMTRLSGDRVGSFGLCLLRSSGLAEPFASACVFGYSG